MRCLCVCKGAGGAEQDVIAVAGGAAGAAAAHEC